MNTSNSKKSKTIQLKKLTAGIEELRKRNAELEKMKAPEEETCTGCITGEPNQLAHMDPGGCLYSPEEYEENDWEEEDTIEELLEENQQLRLKMKSLEDLISQCEPSIRNYLRGRNWRAPEDEENDCEDAPKTIEQLREENQQLRLNRRSLENRISGCEPSVRDFLFG